MDYSYLAVDSTALLIHTWPVLDIDAVLLILLVPVRQTCTANLACDIPHSTPKKKVWECSIYMEEWLISHIGSKKNFVEESIRSKVDNISPVENGL